MAISRCHRQQAGAYGSGRVFGIWVDAKPVGARLAGDGDFMGAIVGTPPAASGYRVNESR
jgi:hypothetical protein